MSRRQAKLGLPSFDREAAQRYGLLFRYLGVPLAAALFGLIMIVMSEAEVSGVALLVVMGTAFAAGVFFHAFNGNILDAALGGAWPPALLAYWKIYWKMDMPSPGGSAANMFQWATGRAIPAWAAVAAWTAAASVCGWSFMRLDGYYKRKTGRSMFDE